MITSIILFLTAHSFVLSIEPARIAGLAINDTFRVSVKVGDVAHLYAYNVSITFDSLVLEAIQVTKGSFLGGTWLAPTIKPGKVEGAAEFLMNPAKSKVGSGTLFTVKFKVKGTGNSSLHLYFSEVNLSDTQAQSLPYFTLFDAWYGTQSNETKASFKIADATDAQELPSAVWFPPVSRYVVTWQDNRSGNYNIYGQQVNTDGTLYGSNYIVCDSVGNQMQPAIAYNPTGGTFKFALAVWTDYRRGADSSDIYGRLLYQGAPAAAAEFPIGKFPGFQINPQIACCGSRYLVVWQDIRDDGGKRDTSHIYGQLLTNQGLAIGSAIRISPSEVGVEPRCNYNMAPGVTAGESGFLITWSHRSRTISSNTYQFYGRLVDTLGNIGELITVTYPPPATIFFEPSCAFDGTNYLVIWNMWQGNGEQLKAIRGQLISKTGMLVGATFGIYQTPESLVQAPKVNFDGANYLVVWDEELNNGIDIIRGRFISPSGNMSNLFDFCSAPYQQAFPAITKGVTNCLGAWQDYRNGTDYNIWGSIITDMIPPNSTSITKIEKSDNNVKFYWNKVSTDLLGSPEKMRYYVAYRDTSPTFIPEPSDSIGYAVHPETSFTNNGVISDPKSYYYLVVAVDSARNKSRVSNLGFKFRQFLNENPDEAENR